MAEVASADATFRALAAGNVDVVLLDLDLVDEDGPSLLARIAAASTDARILVLTEARDPERHRAALLAGAQGVVTKDRPCDLVLKAIRKVAAGELWFERRVLERVLVRSGARSGPHERDALTGREAEIVSLIGEGLKNAAIARHLRIREKTVSNHLTSIFDKLGVYDRVGLLIRAYQLGMATLPRTAASQDEEPLARRGADLRGGG